MREEGITDIRSLSHAIQTEWDLSRASNGLQCSCNIHNEEPGGVRATTVSSTLWSLGAGVGTRGLCEPGKLSYRGFTPNIPLGCLEILSATLEGGQTCRIWLASQSWCTLPPNGE